VTNGLRVRRAFPDEIGLCLNVQASQPAQRRSSLLAEGDGRSVFRWRHGRLQVSTPMRAAAHAAARSGQIRPNPPPFRPPPYGLHHAEAPTGVGYAGLQSAVLMLVTDRRSLPLSGARSTSPIGRCDGRGAHGKTPHRRPGWMPRNAPVRTVCQLTHSGPLRFGPAG
jgi:hypothetical protein